MTKKPHESELTDAAQQAVPIDRAAIGTRISEMAKAIGGKQRLSEKSGVSIAQVHRYTGDDVEQQALPRTEALIAMCRATGYSIHWACTGLGPKMAADVERYQLAEATELRCEEPHPWRNDVMLIQQSVIAVESYLQKNSLMPPPERKALIVALVYDTARATGLDPEKTLEAIPDALRAA